MYLAYKYARKKYRERQQEKAEQPPAPKPSGPDGPQSDDTRVLAASPQSFTPTDPSSVPQTAENLNTAEPEPKETPEERAEKQRRRKYRLKIILGLFLPFALQALDTTIIASALKFIADDFRQSSPVPSVSPFL
jgi:hypothetical protein